MADYLASFSKPPPLGAASIGKKPRLSRLLPEIVAYDKSYVRVR